jgi:hypothetical protein
MYFLIFSSHFDRDIGIDIGRLVLHHCLLGHQEIWLTYSSHKKGQEREGFHKWGGMIPPQYRVPNLKHWTVNTVPEDSSHVRGVRGSFYRISPYQVTTDKGGVRSAFGIHRDADAPGSLGCIVMSDDRFKSFEFKMRSLLSKDITSVPLIVIYS